MVSQDESFTIAIVGGGLGGLALAIGLLRQNVNVHIYEAAHAFAEIGAGVAFGPNARRAMALIDERVHEGYETRATANEWPEKKGIYFDFRLGQDLEGRMAHDKIAEVVTEKGITGSSSVHRAHFLDELVKLVPEKNTSFGKRAEEIEQLPEGVRLRFQDGTAAEASAVIGCDGIKSRTRQVLFGFHHPSSHAIFTGKHAYRGLIPMSHAVDLLGDELARNSQMYLGQHGDVLTFPIEKGKTMNVVAFHSKQDGKWEDDAWAKHMEMNEMMKDFNGWGDDVRKILNMMQHPDVWAIFHHPPAPTYFEKRICLLGDAAHASSPHQGAGAGMVIEDAYVLSSLLGKIKDSKHLEKVFEAYDTFRRPRAQKVVETSADAGELYDLEAEETGTCLDKIGKNVRIRWRWIWDIDLVTHLYEAENQLQKLLKDVQN